MSLPRSSGFLRPLNQGLLGAAIAFATSTAAADRYGLREFMDESGGELPGWVLFVGLVAAGVYAYRSFDRAETRARRAELELEEARSRLTQAQRYWAHYRDGICTDEEYLDRMESLFPQEREQG